MANYEFCIVNYELKKVLVALGIALLVVFAVRALAFTIYTVPTDISPELKRGNRVVVNKLARTNVKVGDLVVFRKKEDYIGKVEAVPGDTVMLDTACYVLPQTCCAYCDCAECRLYMVSMGKQRVLVRRHEMVGKAYRLFRWRW